MKFTKRKPLNFFTYLFENTSAVSVIPAQDIPWPELAITKFVKLFGYDPIALIADSLLYTDTTKLHIHVDSVEFDRAGFAFSPFNESKYFSGVRTHDLVLHGFFDYFKYFEISPLEMKTDALFYLHERGYFKDASSVDHSLPTAKTHKILRLRG